MSCKKFESEVSPRIPPLAWLLTVSEHQLSLEAGTGVEIHASESSLHVFEGAWDGDFDDFGFADAQNFFGTGFSGSGDRLTFCTPTHTLDSLYVAVETGRLMVSNSIAFVVQRAGLRIRPGSGISAHERSILYGVNNYDTTLYSEGERRLLRLAFCNFEMVDGEPRVARKMAGPSFLSFSDYKVCVTEAYGRILRNASDPKRKRRYTPLTTISSGYDSTACAAIAANLGCKNAVTVGSSRDGESDSGAVAAEQLGLSCQVFSRPNLMASGGSPEAEFIASGCGGDVAVTGFADQLSGVVLSTGYHGDRVWGIHHPATADLAGIGVSGSGLTELRLRSDFIHAPLAFIGAVRHDDLLKIGLSEEMSPYRIGGRYDRPIPRRIVEEAGGSRSAFGQSKQVINFLLSSKESALTPSMRKAVDQLIRERLGFGPFWLVKLQNAPRRLIAALWKLGYQLSLGRSAPSRKAGKLVNLATLRADALYERAFPFTKTNDALFIAAIEMTAERYRRTGSGLGGSAHQAAPPIIESRRSA